MSRPHEADKRAGGIEVAGDAYLLRRRQAAMGSVFEITLDGDRPEVELRALIESAFTDVVEPLEMQLSYHRSGSEVSWINANAHRDPVRVEPRLFDLLIECESLTTLTEGAFDITIGPLVKCWGFYRRDGRVPPEGEILAARERTGMEHVLLDAERRTVAFDREGVEIDLGGVGKGYVVDRTVEYLRRCGARCSLVESGGSTIYAMGSPPVDPEGWHVGIRPGGADMPRLGSVHLADNALSTSGDFQQHFLEGGVRYGHIIDPRIGWPAQGIRAACAVTASATRADALSTAFVVLGAEGTSRLCSKHGERALLVSMNEAGTPEIQELGQPFLEPTRPTNHDGSPPSDVSGWADTGLGRDRKRRRV